MKYVLAFLFAVVIAQGAVVYTEPIRLSGTGSGYLFLPASGIQESGFRLVMGGSSSEANLSIEYSELIYGHPPPVPLPADFGFSNASVGGPRSGVANLGPFRSESFMYYVSPLTRAGELTLFDAASNEVASAPIIGYFDYTLLWRSDFPNGGFHLMYSITVLPTPEPATWQLGLLGLVPFVVFAHKRRSPGSAARFIV